AHFRIWAPAATKVALVVESAQQRSEIDMTLEEDGYVSCTLPDAADGLLYRFRIDGGDRLHPDPASRFQPQGPDGPSQLIDPAAFAWQDRNWQGIAESHRVLYEMHIGTFTREGTFRAAQQQL